MKPILFNTEMVRAILDGRKTQTRRVVKLKYSNTHLEMRTDKYGTRLIEIQNEEPGVTVIKHADGSSTHRLLAYIEPEPPYRRGDILYVRETWSTRPSNHCHAQPRHGGKCPYSSCDSADGPCFPDEYIYKASDNLPECGGKWHPSIHMPREAARLFLRVTDVRAERLQESFFFHGATIRNIAAEGIDIGDQCRECIETYGNPCCIDEESECGVLDDVRDDFARLWDSTIKPADRERYGWAANPWVWVIEFERCEKPNDRCSH